MAWWEWAIMLALWGWVMVDLRLLRQALRAVDARRIERCQGLQIEVDTLERKLRRWP